MPEDQPRAGRSPEWVRIGAVVGAAIVVAFLVWLLAIRNGDDNGGSSDNAASSGATGPAIVTPSDLSAYAAGVGHPVYWAGTRTGTQVELWQVASGNIFVRYLEGGAKAGDPSPDFLTIATYPFKNALAALRAKAAKPGEQSESLAHGGFLLYGASNPKSVYVAYPNQDVEIEVYDPNPQQALEVARNELQPLG
jgi:hypothetical protein